MTGNIIVLIGPPGGGKGSLSKLCLESFGWLQLSTGNLCRDHIARQTEIGKKIDFIIKSGKLISDELIAEMIENWLKENLSNSCSVIFDGYPRTVAQVKALKNLLESKFKEFKLSLIKLSVNEEILINRLASRIVCSNNKCQQVYSGSGSLGSLLFPQVEGICDKCKYTLIRREDDREEAIRERLSFYRKSENELVDYCNKIGFNISELNAEQSIEKVFEDFKKILR